MERWSGRVALVTGASSGIGAGVAKELVKQGLKVVGVARRVNKIKVTTFTLPELTISEDTVESNYDLLSAYDYAPNLFQLTVDNLRNAPGTLYPFECDLTKEEDILATFDWIKRNLGGVDILVNNAGSGDYQTLLGEQITTLLCTYFTCEQKLTLKNIAGNKLKSNMPPHL
uniref:Dehydrogenase/reductase SDR family member 11 n=1 Tax=Timema shepardi TaxID=629360 RepID=A0A7R9B5R6_TIMSH|nr:unnamed protein product [Timema shepardi]